MAFTGTFMQSITRKLLNFFQNIKIQKKTQNRGFFSRRREDFFNFNSRLAVQQDILQNPIVNMCINKIATDSSNLKLLILFKENVNEDIKNLVDKFFDNPNGKAAKTDFFYNVFYDLIVKGESFIYFNEYDFYVLEPTEVKILQDQYGPISYQYRNIVSDPKNMIHIKDSFKVKTGMSRIFNARSCIELNKSIERMLKVFTDLHQKLGIIAESDEMDFSQSQEIEKKLNEKFNSDSETLNNLILSGGLKVKILPMPDIKLDYLTDSDKRICTVLGINHKLFSKDTLQYEGTFESLTKIYFQDTIIPLVKTCMDQVGLWLSGLIGSRIEIEVDYNQIPSYRNDQINVISKLQNISFLTDEEKRKMANLPPKSTLSY